MVVSINVSMHDQCTQYNIMSVFRELQRRSKCQLEQWDTDLLYRFSEDQCVDKLESNQGSWEEVVMGKKSTMAIAFSPDGEFMASGHLTHEIAICQMVPRICHVRTLAGHSRTPWCLTFDPWKPHLLFSGCLAGTVHKWDVRTGECDVNSFSPGISAPVNSIEFVPWDSSLILVALERWLYLLDSDNFQLLWQAQTATPSTRVKLVLHHPHESIMLVAITNPLDVSQPTYLRTSVSVRTTYRLQIYRLHREYPPDLDDSSIGLISMSARIYGPRSCILTENYVACSSVGDQGHATIKLYSICQQTFGVCLCSVQLRQSHTNVVSLDLSPCGRHLLLGTTSRRDMYHMNRLSPHTVFAMIYRIESSSAGIKLSEVCVAHSAKGQSSNVATWVPLVCCHGTCITVGTQRGSLFHWGLDSRPSKDRHHSIASSHDHSRLPSYPQIPIPPVQVRITTGLNDQ